MIVVHVDLGDEELKKAVQKAVEGEIVSLTRDALNKVVTETVENKISLDNADSRFTSMVNEEVKKQIKEYISSQMSTQMWIERGKLTPVFAQLVKEQVRDIIKQGLSGIV